MHSTLVLRTKPASITCLAGDADPATAIQACIEPFGAAFICHGKMKLGDFYNKSADFTLVQAF